MTRFKGNFEKIWNGGIKRWQNWLISDHPDHFTMTKLSGFLCKWFPFKYIGFWEQLVLTFLIALLFESHYSVKMGPTFVTSTFLHFKKKYKISFQPGRFYAKIILILYAQKWYLTTKVMLLFLKSLFLSPLVKVAIFHARITQNTLYTLSENPHIFAQEGQSFWQMS